MPWERSISLAGYREDDGPALLSGVVDGCAVVSLGMTLTVAERARVPIIGFRYGLPRYFAR